MQLVSFDLLGVVALLKLRKKCLQFIRYSLAWPNWFFGFIFVFSATTKKNGKKRSGHVKLAISTEL